MTTPLALLLPKLERPAFFAGQLLAPDDLDAVYAYHRDVRRLHNRTLHNWGIGVGLNVTGAKGAREVTVSAGYALDCEGRDLLLTEPVTLPVPAVAGVGTAAVPYYLTASYVEDRDLVQTESRTGVCEGSGVVRRIEALRVRWQRPTDLAPASRYRRGFDLILASAAVRGCALDKAAHGGGSALFGARESSLCRLGKHAGGCDRLVVFLGRRSGARRANPGRHFAGGFRANPGVPGAPRRVPHHPGPESNARWIPIGRGTVRHRIHGAGPDAA